MGFFSQKESHLSLILISSFFYSCSDSSREVAETKDIFVSGSVSVSSIQNFSPQDVSLGNFFIYCQTFGSDYVSSSGKLESSGSFEIEIKNAKDLPLNCFLVSLLTEYVASISFVNSNLKNIDGSSLESPYMAFSGDTELSIQMDFGKAKGLAEISEATTLTTVTPETWDLTGTWTFSNVDSVLPPTMSSLCESGTSQYSLGSSATCWGPEEDQTFYFKQFSGVDSNQANVDAVMVWKDSSSFSGCGSKLGYSFSALNTNSEIDFTNSGVTEGTFNYATTLTGADSLTSNWQSNAATTTYSVLDCGPHTQNGSTYWRCLDSTSGNYRIEKYEGCINATLDPITVGLSNWGGVTWAADDISDDGDFKLNTMAGTLSAAAISCFSRYAYTNGSQTINNALTFNWGNVASVIGSGQACSSINGTTYPLARLKCYEKFYKSNIESANGCVRDMRFNSLASDASQFVLSTQKAKNLYLYGRSVDGVSGFKTLTYETQETLSVEFKDSGGKVGYAFCPVSYRTWISLMPVEIIEGAVTELTVVFQNEIAMENASTACKSHMKNTLKGEVYIVSESDAVLVARQKVLAKLTKN
jgi:hypothetical protein